MKKVLIEFPFILPSFNQYIAKDRASAYAGASYKKKHQRMVELILIRYKAECKELHVPVRLDYTFHEANRKRDHDNVSAFAHKVIQDALVAQKILPDDGWDEITGYSDTFVLDKKNPHIELVITEVNDG